MKNDYCIIKVYAATGNEYVVKNNLTFDEAQEEFENLNSTIDSHSGEQCMYIIGDSGGSDLESGDAELLDEDEDDGYDLEREFGSFGIHDRDE